MVVPAFVANLALGGPYAWSIMANTLSKELGFVAQAADDWTLAQTSYPLSITATLMGITAGLASTY